MISGEPITIHARVDPGAARPRLLRSGHLRRLRRALGIDWIAVIAAVVASVGCGGGGCGGCGFESIPGGFPAAKRDPNAVQVRVTQSGLAAVTADPAALLDNLAGATNGVLRFNAPVSCGGTTPTCCPGGNPQNPCGPILIDFKAYPGDSPRLELAPAAEASRLDLTARARVRTQMDIPVKVPLIGDCGVKIDTAGGAIDDIQIDAPISFQQDPAAGTTRVVVGTVNLANLAADDVKLTGSIACSLANLGLSFFINILRDQLTGAVQSAIQDQTCKACDSGSVAECGAVATACTGKVCMVGDRCMQELGLTGRARGASLFGSLSPGTTGAIDVYEVAGGYATSNSNGLALGLLGGILPAGTERDRCGPPAAAPPRPTIPMSPFYQGNVRPDNGQRFDLGFGVHRSQLDAFAYAAYDGGLLCLTITGGTIAQLSTDTLSLISRSLGRLVEGNSPMAVGVRPQRPPVIKLGRNLFGDDGHGGKTVTEPLLDLTFSGLELDFFASVDDQYVRVFTVVADVHLPVGLQVTAMGELAPVIGNPEDAFTNLAVKNSAAVTETPAELAALFPNVLALVIPQLSGSLSSISLPSIGGLDLAVTDVTGLPANPGGADVSFLAIFANLAPAAVARPVETRVTLGEITEPARAIAADPTRWRGARGPTVALELAGALAGPARSTGLEWSYRIDRGTWSAWSTDPHPTIGSTVFWLPGVHRVDLRAREVGRPETIDLTPETLEVELGTDHARRTPVRGFHGQPGEGGCSCDAGGSAPGSLPLVLAVGLIVLPVRRLRRSARRAAGRLGPVVVLAALASLPGCSCSADHCGEVACIAGDLEPGGLGRWTSIAADDDRVLVATYDHGFGDLVVIDVTDPATPDRLVVDGVPSDATPTHEPGTYRDGIEDPGPDVGAWTSIAIAGGVARVAYQDRDAHALKYAFETATGRWQSYVVDGDGPEDVGRYASLAIDAEGRPAIAYIAIGIDDGTGHRVTELRIARARAQQPGVTDWSRQAIAVQPGTCGGLCGPGEACVAGAGAETCAAITATCTSPCADDEACVAGACTTAIAGSKVASLATGTGLFVKLVVLRDGRLAAAYYDRTNRALELGVETAAGAGAFTETELHGGATGDRGLWTAAVVDGAGTIHVAYQDAIADQLMYVSWNGTASAPEVVDDGQRSGDRTHSVGAGAAIYLSNGVPSIAYQDGMTADVYVATKSAASWTTTAIATGPLLDGFSIAAASHAGAPYLAWDRLDPAVSPPHTIYVTNP